MKTIILETTRARADRFAEHLVNPVIRRAGRLVAVQSQTLEKMGESAIRDLVAANEIPLRRIVEVAKVAAAEITRGAAEAAKEAAADAARDAVNKAVPWVFGGLGVLVVGGVTVAVIRRRK